MWRAGVFVLVLVSVAGASPNRDIIDKWYKEDPLRWSNDLWEDARLDLPDLIRKYGYPCESHQVTSEDGYVIGMQRIPYSPGRNEGVEGKPAVLLMHGLTSAAPDYIIMGHNVSLGRMQDICERRLIPGGVMQVELQSEMKKGKGYILADEGYDVWLGNNRGNYYSREHATLNWNEDKRQYWDFSWHEIGVYDLPAMIDYILEKTDQLALHYIGHSQGTTVFFVMCSALPQYNFKIRSMNALAPVAYMKDFQHPVLTPMAQYTTFILALVNFLNVPELLVHNNYMLHWAGYAICGDDNGDTLQEVCDQYAGNVMITEDDPWNSTMIAVILGHSPSGAAWKQFAHYGQNILSEEFRRFDYGADVNIGLYGSATPPAYDLSNIFAPVALHYSENDVFTPNENVYRLRSELGYVVLDNFIDNPLYGHVDFIWNTNNDECLHRHILEVLRNH